MSVNYYWRTAEDEANGEEGLHIGKWVNHGMSSLRGYLGSESERPILSWQDWTRFLRENDANGRIVAEHGLVEEVETFIADVENAPRSERSRTMEWLRSYANPGRSTFRARIEPYGHWSDAEGYTLYAGEFC